MGSISVLVFRRFFLRLLWVALLTSFGIHLFLTALPAKRLVDPNARFDDAGAVTYRKWDFNHYLKWITGTLTGSMQISDQGSGSWEQKDFAMRVTNSLLLCTLAFLIAAALGIALGVYQASLNFELLSGPPGGFDEQLSNISRWTVFFFSSMPAYIIAYLMFLGISSQSSMAFAVVALALGSGTAMDVARMTQNTHARQLRSRYIESAIANGLKTRGLLPRPGYVGWHAFRNSLITILPVTAMRLPLIVSAAMMVEVVFDLPGMGESLLGALIGQDVPRILSIVLISVVFTQVCLFLAEFLVFLLHPKALTN
ncbi:MAG: ABC transporter permease [bacterium]|nr:ABC transporter permease [bacterium]